MKLSLKNLAYFNGKDSLCFTLNLFLEGKKVASVANSGSGGCHEYWWHDKNAEKEIEAWANAQSLSYISDEETHQVEQEKLDWIISEMITDIEEKKRLKHLCKKNTLAKFKGEEKGVYQSWKVVFTPTFKEKLLQTHGDVIEYFVNERI